jgi:hypothetical protein
MILIKYIISADQIRGKEYGGIGLHERERGIRV